MVRSGGNEIDVFKQMLQTSLPGLYCPSRRQAKTYLSGVEMKNYGGVTVQMVGKTDYALNGGDRLENGCVTGPPDLATGLSPSFNWMGLLDDSTNTGLSAFHQLIGIEKIRDGTSNTLMIGEKYLAADLYTTGTDGGDNQSAYQGHDVDTIRFVEANFSGSTPSPLYRPWIRQDTQGWPNYHIFGSPHPSGCQFAFCDGSVRTINFTIDFETLRRLANQKDGLVVDDRTF